MSSTYTTTPEGVRMSGRHGDINLTLPQAFQLLGIYREAGAKAEFLELWDAYHAHPDAVPAGASTFRSAA